jgi:D-alanyl-D-alanine carboxypeptidase
VPFDGHYGYGHLGRIDGFSSALYHFSDQNISMAFISNGTNYENNNIALALLDVIYYNYYEIPKFETIDVSSEELDQYLGVYASKQIALKIAITKDGNTLIAQATGQSSFPLEATEKDKFKFEKAGIVLEFKPTNNTMVLKQGGGTFNFIRE